MCQYRCGAMFQYRCGEICQQCGNERACALKCKCDEDVKGDVDEVEKPGHSFIFDIQSGGFKTQATLTFLQLPRSLNTKTCTSLQNAVSEKIEKL